MCCLHALVLVLVLCCLSTAQGFSAAWDAMFTKQERNVLAMFVDSQGACSFAHVDGTESDGTCEVLSTWTNDRFGYEGSCSGFTYSGRDLIYVFARTSSESNMKHLYQWNAGIDRVFRIGQIYGQDLNCVGDIVDIAMSPITGELIIMCSGEFYLYVMDFGTGLLLRPLPHAVTSYFGEDLSLVRGITFDSDGNFLAYQAQVHSGGSLITQSNLVSFAAHSWSYLGRSVSPQMASLSASTASHRDLEWDHHDHSVLFVRVSPSVSDDAIIYSAGVGFGSVPAWNDELGIVAMPSQGVHNCPTGALTDLAIVQCGGLGTGVRLVDVQKAFQRLTDVIDTCPGLFPELEVGLDGHGRATLHQPQQGRHVRTRSRLLEKNKAAEAEFHRREPVHERIVFDEEQATCSEECSYWATAAFIKLGECTARSSDALKFRRRVVDTCLTPFQRSSEDSYFAQ